ncbi:MAG: ABC transporter substrate-binding protein [Chthonomonadales bacterium]|nr:ABC transporter substrate-binding protein [Chthonomonadales bacterium]
MRLIASLLVGVLLATARPADGQPQARSRAPIVVTDVRGVSVTLREPPRRIVSLAPAVTEILFAIGAGSNVVGVTAFCDYPKAARRLPRVGDLNVSAEKVLGLKPDLVIGDVEANRKSIALLERLAPLKGRLFVVAGKDFREIFAAVESVGRVTGRAAEAARSVARMKRTLAQIRAQVARSGARPRTVFVVQTEPLWLAGSGTFIDDLITAAGGQNLGRMAGRGYRSFSLERLIALSPDVIVSSDASLRSLRGKAGWNALAAVRAGRVYVLGYDAVRPGPRLAEAVVQLHRWLHPRP